MSDSFRIFRKLLSHTCCGIYRRAFDGGPSWDRCFYSKFTWQSIHQTGSRTVCA